MKLKSIKGKSLLFIGFATLLLNGKVSAQNQIPEKKTALPLQEECLSAQRHKFLMQTDPTYKSFREADEEYLLNASKNQSVQKAVITIPVVVHVMHTGQAVSTIGSPTVNISDAQIQSAIDYMTKAYRGQSPYNGIDTQIEFCLAKRDPNGNPSTGIVRVNASSISNYSTQGVISSNEVALKALSKWDNTKYYNVWIVTEIDNNDGGSGTQGYAYFAGASSTYDGAIMLYNAFGYDINGTIGYNLKSYTNLNVTPIHEIGHALNLYHTFEGDGSGSTCPTTSNGCGSDVGDCCTDTPDHKRSNSDCVVGTNSCTGGSSALHIHNFMDYSSDDCQTQFTSDQYTVRMSPTLVSGGSRYSLTQSNGCNPVYANDASISAVVAPNGSYCMTTFSPVVTLLNSGSATLTSATITYDIDGGTSQVYNWTGSLASNTSVDVTLNSMTTTSGAHTFTATTSLPNGVADEYTTNDSKTVSFTISVSTLPFTETFEGSFVPTGWTRNSADVADGSAWAADGIKQWEKRSTSGNGTSTASAAMNYAHYNYNTGDLDELVSPAIDLSGTSAPELTFNVAHAYYGSSNQERLRVLISTDCGVTYTSIYDKSYSTLATVGQMTADFSPTLASHWRLETLDLTAYAGSSIVLKFEGTNGYGNNLYLDDINVSEPCNAPTISNQPSNVTVCPGANTNITTTAAGVATLTYQWQVSTNGGGTWNNVTNGGVYSTETTASLTITGATSDMDSYQYKCIVTNGCGTVTSNAAVLTVGSISAPTGSASQSFCMSGTIADLVATGTAIQWYAASSGGTALASTDALADATSYYATQTVSGCESPTRFEVTVSINSTPTSAPTGNASQTYCSSATVADLVATGTAIQWYAASSGGTALASTDALVDATIYYATQTVSGCESTTRFAVTVTISGSTSAPTGSATQSFCNNETVADLVATGTAIQWYSTSTGGSALATTDALVDATTYYATQTVSGCESASRLAVAVTVGSSTTPTGSASQTFCGSSSTVADLAVTGTSIQWYAASSGGSPLATSTVLVNGTTYYATQTISGCESSTRLAVSVTVTTTGAPTGSASQSFCGSSTVADLTATGTSIQWYSASTGGSPLATSTTLVDGTTYYATQTAGGCESASRFAVTVTVGSTAAPTGSASQSFCNSGTVADLVATGTSIQWFAASSGGSSLATSTALVNGTTYYASQTVNGCNSTTRLAVTVSIVNTAAPTGSASQSMCPTSTVADLVATGSSIQWYTTSTGGTALASSTTLTNGATYYASQTVSGCVSSSRLAVTVTIGTAPSAPTGSASQSFCGSATVADLVATGTNIQWYAGPSGGTPLAGTTALSNGSNYYATQTSGCESTSRLVVAVTINAAPTVTLSSFPTVCNTDAAFNLTQGSPIGGTYSGTGVSSGSFNPATAGAGTVTITYTYTNVNLCTGTATGTILVNDCVSIPELSKSGYLIYPNPVNGFVTIKSNNEAIKTVKLFDNTGRLIASQDLSEFDAEIKLDLSNYANGIYTVQITSESRVVNSQIMVEK